MFCVVEERRLRTRTELCLFVASFNALEERRRVFRGIITPVLSVEFFIFRFNAIQLFCVGLLSTDSEL